MKTKNKIVSAIFSTLVFAASFNVSFAQVERTNSDRKNERTNTDRDNRMQTEQQSDKDAIWLKDGYMVKDGKVMIVSNGKITNLAREITFKNGDKITPNAVLVKKDGEKKTLKNGDYLDMDGQLKTRQAMSVDCMMMKDGKMYITKDGKTTVLDKETTLKNGTVCSASGTCTTKEGKKMTLRNGECMDMEGRMMEMDKENRMMNK